MEELDSKKFFTDAIFEEMHRNVALWITMADHLGAPRKKVIRQMLQFTWKMAKEAAKTIEDTSIVSIDMEEFEKQMEEMNETERDD